MNTAAAQSTELAEAYALIAEQELIIEKLQGELAELRRMLFGKSSERLPRIARELQKRRHTNGEPLGEGSAQVIRDKRANTPALKKELPTEDVSHPVTCCPHCQSIVCAPPPPRVADNTLFGPKLHAHVVVRKNLDAIPLYRQAAQLQRDGLPIDDTTLGRMYHRTAELLEPLAKRILELVRSAPYVNADVYSTRGDLQKRLHVDLFDRGAYRLCF